MDNPVFRQGISLVHSGIPWEVVFGDKKFQMNRVWRNATVIVLNELNGADYSDDGSNG